MSAKKKPTRIELFKKAHPLTKEQSTSSEKLANKELSTIKEIPQRACIDCHFLVKISLFDCKFPPDVGVSGYNHYIYLKMLTKSRELEFSDREKIQARRGFSNTALLGCWHKRWIEYDEWKTKQTQRELENQHTQHLFKFDRPHNQEKLQELYGLVVEEDRSSCNLFYPYTEGMSFEAAVKIHEITLLQLIRDTEQRNKAETEESKKPKAKKVTHKKGKLKRGEKQNYVPKEELIKFVKKDLKFLTSSEGGRLSGGALTKKIQKNIRIKFEDKYGEKAKYEESTVRNLISEIKTKKI